MVNKNSNIQNMITKESIFTALMILMEKKNFKEISITEITKRAGVSRMAFYRNYNVIEDIITSYLDELFKEYSRDLSIYERKDGYESVCLYFAYFRQHDQLINNLIKSNLDNLIFERGVAYLHSFSKDIVCKKSYPPIKERYNIEFIAGGFYKVLIEWAKSGMKESDEDMAKMLYDLF